MAFFHCTQKGEIYFSAGGQLRRDQPAETAEFSLGTGLHQFSVLQTLVNPVPALQLAKRIPEGIAAKVFFLFGRFHAAGDDPDLVQGRLVEEAFALGKNRLKIGFQRFPVLPVHAVPSFPQRYLLSSV